MRNIRITLQYKGASFCGWQAQRIKSKGRRPNTLQETIEKALKKILQEEVSVVGSGRTDAGVHAEAQVANFRTRSEIPLDKLARALNGVLPADISVSEVKEAKSKFHSRFDVRSKVYRYTILNQPYRSAFFKDTAYFFPHPLDLKRMRKEARLLLGRHDFKSFQASDKKDRSSVRRIKKLSIKKEAVLIRIDIEADGFLYNMVRNIAGTLIEIGRGRFPEGSMKRILRSRDRAQAGPTLPAKGLCLMEVKY